MSWTPESVGLETLGLGCGVGIGTFLLIICGVQCLVVIVFLIWMFLCSRSDNVKAGDQYTAVYIIRGLLLGRTNLVATAVQHGRKDLMTSDERMIQVCSNIFTC